MESGGDPSTPPEPAPSLVRLLLGAERAPEGSCLDALTTLFVVATVEH